MRLLILVLLCAALGSTGRRVLGTRAEVRGAEFQSVQMGATALAKLLLPPEAAAAWHRHGHSAWRHPLTESSYLHVAASRGELSMYALKSEETQEEAAAASLKAEVKYIRTAIGELRKPLQSDQEGRKRFERIRRKVNNAMEALESQAESFNKSLSAAQISTELPQVFGDDEMDQDQAFEAFMRELQATKADELRHIVWHQGATVGYDWKEEDLHSVDLFEANSSMLAADVITCTPKEETCQQMTMGVHWPKDMPVSKWSEMWLAWTAIVRNAYFSLYELPDVEPGIDAQQQEVSNLMKRVNSEFREDLRVFVLNNAEDSLEGIFDIKEVKMTALNYQGFTLKLNTLDEEALTGESLNSKSWSISVLFQEPCTSGEAVEQQLMQVISMDLDEKQLMRGRWKQFRSEFTGD